MAGEVRITRSKIQTVVAEGEATIRWGGGHAAAGVGEGLARCTAPR